MRRVSNISNCENQTSSFLAIIIIFLWICGIVIENVVGYMCVQKEYPETNAHGSHFDVFPTAWQWSISLQPFIDMGTSTKEATLWKNILDVFHTIHFKIARWV